MDNRIDLITRQDIDAFADGELDGVRLDAVLRRLGGDDQLLAYAFKAVRTNAEILSLKKRLYSDAELKRAVKAALSGSNVILKRKVIPLKSADGKTPCA